MNGKAGSPSRVPRYKIVQAKLEDIQPLVDQGLRSQDEDELAALGVSPAQAFEDGITLCPEQTFTIFCGDQPAGMFGIVPHGEGTAIIWMLGTDLLHKYKVALIRDVRTWLDEIQKTYPYIHNWVSDENTVSCEWLEVLGFKFTDETFNTTKACFRRFYRCATPS